MAAELARNAFLSRGWVLPGLLLVFVAVFVLAGSAHAQGMGAQGPSMRSIGIGFVRHASGPWTARIADGGFTTATGRSLRWLPHDTDSAVASALAAGKLDVALIGASVAVSAAARGIDIKIIYVVGHAADADGLVLGGKAMSALADPKALQGKVIATPFGSTPHFRLLEAMKRWGLSASSMRLVNLQTGQIAEAWKRSEIDGAMVSEPLLGLLAQKGERIKLPDGGPFPGLMVLAASSEFVASHTVFLSRLIDVIARSELDPTETVSEEERISRVQSISFITGLSGQAIEEGMRRYQPPPLAEQASSTWLGGGSGAGLVQVLKDIAEVLKLGGRLAGRDVDLAQMIAPGPVQLALTYR